MKNKVLSIMLVGILFCITILVSVFIGRVSSKNMIHVGNYENITTGSDPDFEPLNLNTIRAEELITYLKLSKGLAEEIVAYRNTYGDYVYLSELKSVPGMTEDIYNRIKPYLTISDG